MVISANIIKFDRGSRRHLTETFLTQLHGYNFKVYDWNMVAADRLQPYTSSDRLYREATEGSKLLPSVILLLHCDYMHKNTCIALPRIIRYYKNEGYEFKAITEETPERYFPIVKK